MIVEEFAPKEIRHIAGEDNAVADCLSRMEIEPRDFDLIETEALKPMLEYCNMLQSMEQLNTLKDSLKETIDKAQFPQAPKLISEAQKECEMLKKLIEDDDKKQLSVKNIEGVELAHYFKKKYVPGILKEAILEWYHKVLVHPGTSRLEAALRQMYWWPNLRKDFEKCCKHCHVCQLAK